MLSIIGQKKEFTERKIGENKSKIDLSLATIFLAIYNYSSKPIQLTIGILQLASQLAIYSYGYILIAAYNAIAIYIGLKYIYAYYAFKSSDYSFRKFFLNPPIILSRNYSHKNRPRRLTKIHKNLLRKSYIQINDPKQA